MGIISGLGSFWGRFGDHFRGSTVLLLGEYHKDQSWFHYCLTSTCILGYQKDNNAAVHSVDIYIFYAEIHLHLNAR